MTRPLALQALRQLASGLACDQAGCSRLLERIGSHADAEALRDALVELGAHALLDGQAGAREGVA